MNIICIQLFPLTHFNTDLEVLCCQCCEKFGHGLCQLIRQEVRSSPSSSSLHLLFIHRFYFNFLFRIFARSKFRRLLWVVMNTRETEVRQILVGGARGHPLWVCVWMRLTYSPQCQHNGALNRMRWVYFSFVKKNWTLIFMLMFFCDNKI